MRMLVRSQGSADEKLTCNVGDNVGNRRKDERAFGSINVVGPVAVGLTENCEELAVKNKDSEL